MNMRRIAGSGWVGTMLVVVLWRALSELLLRMSVLREAGELDRRVAARRRARVDRALASWSVSRVRARELARVTVPVTTGPQADASVYVGATGGADLDDIGLLEAAMRRAARDRMAVGPEGVTTRPRRLDWGRLLDRGDDDHGAAAADRVPWWSVVVAAVGVALTVAALVRPLGDPAPVLAIAGSMLVVAALVAGRRS
ncbi:MAG: hypothetical protein KDC46_02465 [Thermoleophilia bacterium]|nr:hypothetical protein [Thermoleophilia bacterium]